MIVYADDTVENITVVALDPVNITDESTGESTFNQKQYSLAVNEMVKEPNVTYFPPVNFTEMLRE